MFTVSNQQMEYIIKYIELMIEKTDTAKTTDYNTVRMARILIAKLRAKKSFSTQGLPDDIKRLLASK